MTNKTDVFTVTLLRLRDLPGLPEESLQDVMALSNLHREAKHERDEARAEVARRDALREKTKSLLLDGPFTFDASNDLPTLKTEVERLTRENGLLCLHLDRALKERNEAQEMVRTLLTVFHHEIKPTEYYKAARQLLGLD